MQSLNRVQLAGNLGRDAETRQTPSGTAVTNFSVATAQSYKDGNGEWQEKTSWHDVVAWRLSEKLTPYLTKGAKVYLEGRLETRSWEDQNGQKRYKTEVITDQRGVMLMRPGKDGPSQDYAEQAQPAPQGQGQAQGGNWKNKPVGDDDIPF